MILPFGKIFISGDNFNGVEMHTYLSYYYHELFYLSIEKKIMLSFACHNSKCDLNND